MWFYKQIFKASLSLLGKTKIQNIESYNWNMLKLEEKQENILIFMRQRDACMLFDTEWV